MKKQKKPYSCGTAAARNALRALGIYVSEHDLWPIAGLTRDGTNEYGIMRAIRHHRAKCEEHRFTEKDPAWNWIHETLQQGRFVILAVENWEHWVIVLGSAGPAGVSVFDPSNFKKNVYENNSHVWNRKKLMFKWWNDRVHLGEDEGDDRIYAISVWK